eukprot:GDKJ01050212.1.p1 GENE.GDKJ01050212.1~~GDKJ01050212.1.p1  ORF type:complete len:440 (-),score=68.88 GDKJ01050212.1:222-1541(-)
MGAVMNLIVAKVLSGLVLTLVGFFGVGIPYFAKRFASNRLFIELAGALGGGAFLGLALFHLIPEASSMMSGTHSHNHDHPHLQQHHKLLDSSNDVAQRLLSTLLGHKTQKPLMKMSLFGLDFDPAYIFIFLGFSLILFVERVAFSSEKVEALHAHDHDHADRSLSHSHAEVRQSLLHVAHSQSGGVDHSNNVVRRSLHASHPIDDNDRSNLLDNDPLMDLGRQVVDDTEDRTRALYASRSRLHSLVGSHIQAETLVEQNRNLPDIAAVETSNEGSHNDIQIGSSSLTTYMMMVALSIHNLFEGIVVGSAGSSNAAFMLCISIIFHHVVAGLALSMGFVKQGVHRGFKARVALGIFVVSLPLGVGIGIGISSASALVSCIANCIAAGTILYVATCEIIAEEFASGRFRRSKFAMFLFGAILLMFLSAIHEKYGHVNHHDD